MGVHYKPQETPATLAAKESYLGRAYLDWAQYPIVEAELLDSGNSIVHFSDLRYARSGRGGKGALSASVELDKDMHVVWQGFGSPPDEDQTNTAK
jgi:inner membrane protein